ncbi:MAG: lysophospholipid acyltransferase family protein [Vicinamibacteraceae bacterium]
MWQTSRWKRLQVAAIAGVGTPVVGVLGRTLRWRVEGAETYGEVLAGGRRPIMAFWHGRILPATLFFRDRGIVVITSENFDGEWIARIIQRFGYGAARGSSSRGAVRALVQLKRLMAGGKPTAFTVDGPRGPARVAQPGALWLAKATGNPILPFHIEAARYWTAGSWDRAQVPRPFSDVAVAIGPPFYVAADTSDEALEVRRRDLEQELGRLEQRALELIRDM